MSLGSYIAKKTKKIVIIASLAGGVTFILTGGNVVAAYGAVKAVTLHYVVDPISNIADVAAEGAAEAISE